MYSFYDSDTSTHIANDHSTVCDIHVHCAYHDR